MDGAPFTTAQRERVVAEAKHAFDLNAALFVDLAGEHEASAPDGSVEVA
jgi:heme oxygenase